MKRRTAKKRVARYWQANRRHWKRLLGSHDIIIRKTCAALMDDAEERSETRDEERLVRMIPVDPMHVAAVKSAMDEKLRQMFASYGGAGEAPTVSFTVRSVE